MNHSDGLEQEKEWMYRIAVARDTDAFDALADRLREPLHRFLLSQVNHDEAATADLLQETLLRLWTRAETFDGRGSVKAWLFRIAGNLASNHRRAVARRRESILLLTDDAEDEAAAGAVPSSLRESAAEGPVSLVLRTAERDRIRRHLRELPDEARELLRLVHDEERDLHEVAQVLGVPQGTVKSRLHYTRKRLARALQADDSL